MSNWFHHWKNKGSTLYQYSFYLFQASWRPFLAKSTFKRFKRLLETINSYDFVFVQGDVVSFLLWQITMMNKPPFGAYFCDFFQPPNKQIWGFSGWNHSVFFVFPSECFSGGKSVECFKRLEFWWVWAVGKMERCFFCWLLFIGYGMKYCRIWSLGYTISHETKGPVMKQTVGM